MADDEIARLLREVEAELARDAPGTAASSSAKELKPAKQAKQDKPAKEPKSPQPAPAPRATMAERARAAVPRGVVVGAVWGLAVGTAFSIVPVVDGLSGALAAFVTGFGVSVAGRVRRR